MRPAVSSDVARRQALRPLLYFGTGMFGCGALGLGFVAATAGGVEPIGLAVTYSLCFVVLWASIAAMWRDRLRLSVGIALFAWTAQAAVAGVLGTPIAALTITAVSFAFCVMLATLLDPESVVPWAGVQAVGWVCVVAIRYGQGAEGLDPQGFWPAAIVPSFLLLVLGIAGASIGRYRDLAIEDALSAEGRAAAASAASDAKSAFLANMSHELRTPLNAIIGYTQLVQEEVGGQVDDEVLGDLFRVEKAGAHLLELINNVLDLSKIEAGRIELERRPFHLASVLEDVERTLKPLAEARGNQLEVLASCAGGELVGDEVRLRQVLINLMANANKFTEAGTVRVRACCDEQGWLVIDVQDTGIGMSAEQCERVFQPFQQADSSTTRRYGGTGLGLAISASLAKRMGGRIDVCSAPGQGSTFTFTVPRELPVAA